MDCARLAVMLLVLVLVLVLVRLTILLHDGRMLDVELIAKLSETLFEDGA